MQQGALLEYGVIFWKILNLDLIRELSQDQDFCYAILSLCYIILYSDFVMLKTKITILDNQHYLCSLCISYMDND